MYVSNIQTRKGVELIVPSVAPLGIVTQFEAVTVVLITVPVASEVDRNGMTTGLEELGVDPAAVVTQICSSVAPPIDAAESPRFIGISDPVPLDAEVTLPSAATVNVGLT